MKLRSLVFVLLSAFVLLLAAVPQWAEEEPIAAPASPQPPSVESTACSTLSAAPMTPADVVTAPFLGALEITASSRIRVCLACRELIPTCNSPGQDAGKPCGDGDPPNTCTCQWCDHTFGCFP